jgi:hypothetical protein
MRGLLLVVPLAAAAGFVEETEETRAPIHCLVAGMLMGFFVCGRPGAFVGCAAAVGGWHGARAWRAGGWERGHILASAAELAPIGLALVLLWLVAWLRGRWWAHRMRRQLAQRVQGELTKGPRRL